MSCVDNSPIDRVHTVAVLESAKRGGSRHEQGLEATGASVWGTASDESDLSERLRRIEARLEDIVRPLLQMRSSSKKLLFRIEMLEAQLRRLQH